MSEYELKKIKILDTRDTSIVKNNKANAKAKVCAYCRVSTDNIEQQTSYESQINYYKNKITNNNDWELVDIYADEGISATSTKNRTSFNKMIKDCEEGKIDIVLTKSISRFSRNIVDCLTYVRKLKDLGIKIIFEKENIDTLSQNGELMLTLLSSLAEEESRSISNNIRWAIEKKFERGEVIVSGCMLGYKTSENKTLEIIEEEAETVRIIFRMFLEGESYKSIANTLEKLGRKTGFGKSKWHYNVIVNILKNEKYQGDAHLQKTYTRDFMDKKRRVNKGDKTAYYVQNSHPAIISRDDFAKVQKEMRRRAIHRDKNNKISNTKYVLSDILVCAECGSPYRRVTWKGQYDEPRYVWRCDNRLKNGKKYCKKSPTLNETLLHRSIMDCIAEISENKSIDQIVLQNKNALKRQDKTFHIDIQKQSLEKELEKYKLEIDKLIEEEIRGGDVEQKYKETSEKIQNIKTELEQYEKEGVDSLEINSISTIDRAFDEGLVRQLIHKINVISKEEIEIEFISAVKIIKKLTEY